MIYSSANENCNIPAHRSKQHFCHWLIRKSLWSIHRKKISSWCYEILCSPTTQRPLHYCKFSKSKILKKTDKTMFKKKLLIDFLSIKQIDKVIAALIVLAHLGHWTLSKLTFRGYGRLWINVILDLDLMICINPHPINSVTLLCAIEPRLSGKHFVMQSKILYF